MTALFLVLSLVCQQSQRSPIDHALINGSFEYQRFPKGMSELRTIRPTDPWFAEAQVGLAIMRRHVIYPRNAELAAKLRPESQWYPVFLFSPWVSVMGFAAWCVVCGSATRWIQVRKRHWLVLGVMMLPFAMVPIINQCVEATRWHRDQVAPPVIINDETQLLAGNGRAYESKAELTRGMECRKIGQRGQWLQVEFASGLIGWVEESGAIIVATHTP